MCQQGICSPADLDVAVTLGLGYPMGPLAMGDRIGPTNVLEVLFNMQTVYGDPRYRPSPWLRRRGALGLSLTHEEGLTMTASLKSHSHGQTMVLTISNPEHRNALGPDIYAAGVEALNVAENNPEIRSVVITGEGATSAPAATCSACWPTASSRPRCRPQSIEGLHNWIETIRAFPKPVIAAWKALAQARVFRWRWPATWWWPRTTACSSWPMQRGPVARRRRHLEPDARHAPRHRAAVADGGERIAAERLQQLGVISPSAPG
jgi:hypothetical protein